MSENAIYTAVPMHERVVPRVEKVLRDWVKEHDGDYYHNIQNPEEKREIGNMIHDINSFLSGLKQKQYTKPWHEFGKFFYPKQYEKRE